MPGTGGLFLALSALVVASADAFATLAAASAEAVAWSRPYSFLP